MDKEPLFGMVHIGICILYSVMFVYPEVFGVLYRSFGMITLLKAFLFTLTYNLHRDDLET
jgi:hypothetical protein